MVCHKQMKANQNNNDNTLKSPNNANDANNAKNAWIHGKYDINLGISKNIY